MRKESEKIIKRVIKQAWSSEFSSDHADWVAEQLQSVLQIEKGE